MCIITKLKFKSYIRKSSNKSTLFKFFDNFFYKCFFICTKMSKTLSAKYYQENKERIPEKLVKDIKIFIKKKKKKKQQYDGEHYKNVLEDEKQKLA